MFWGTQGPNDDPKRDGYLGTGAVCLVFGGVLLLLTRPGRRRPLHGRRQRVFPFLSEGVVGQSTRALARTDGGGIA
jgi:hypothetical protein